MKYARMYKAKFLRRPNRFIAYVELDGQEHICHVKNTGRCRELLVPGATVYIQKAENPDRKTQYDLIKVVKGERLINMDSNAANTVFGEFLAAGGLGFIPEYIKPEFRHGDSRFDFYFEHDGKKAFAEVKGVTLEEDGIVRFPDAPTERGIKHLRGLAELVMQGYEAYVVFIIQMENVRRFEPNYKTHAAFAQVLREAAEAGVKPLAYECLVGIDSLDISHPVEITL